MALTRPKYSNFVDNDFKNSCRIVTTTNITLAGSAPSTYDGVTLVLGDRILVAGQNTGSQNGIYVVATLGTGSNGTWSRSFDASDGSRLSAGAQITIGEGTYGGRLWRLSTPDPITIGSTSLTFLDGAAIAGGSSTQIQFNNSGSLQGVSTLTYVSANTSVVASGNVFAATLYTNQLRWAANSQSITLTGNINPVVYIGNTVIGTSATLVDSFSASGNTMVTWTTVSKDTNNSRYKKSTLDSFNDGTNISFTESGIIRTNPAYSVATFTSNITNGTINLWATGDSASVTITYERRVLGSFSPTGYINNFGPIGPAGSIAETSSNIVTTATSTAVSTTTGALQIAGGAGIAGNLYTGGSIVAGQDLTVLGNLTVQGDVTTLNTTSLAVEDLNITVAKDAASAAQADGAGLTVGGSGATFNYTAVTDAWTSNKNIYASSFYTGGDLKWSSNSAVYRSGINYTVLDIPPINSNYGDQWYDTTSDILYEWQTSNGINGFWVDIGSLAIMANANLSNQAFNTVSANNVNSSANVTAGNLILSGSGANGLAGSTVYANNFVFSNNGASIFSSFGVNSYGNVNVSQYLPSYTGNIQSANVYVVGASSISTGTGALRVVGGAGITGNLNLGGNIATGGISNYYGIPVNTKSLTVISNDVNKAAYLEVIGGAGGVGSINFGNVEYRHGLITSTVDRGLSFYVAQVGSNGNTASIAMGLYSDLSANFTGNIFTIGNLALNGTYSNIGVNGTYGNIAVNNTRGQFVLGTNTRDGVARYITNTATGYYSGMSIQRAATEIFFAGANQQENYVVRTDNTTDALIVGANNNVILAGNITSANVVTGNVTASGNITVAGNLVANGYSNVSIATGSLTNRSALTISGNVYGRGGIGYLDAVQLTNNYSAATNPNKYIRVGSTGTFEIINSAYTTNLFNLTDDGALSLPGPISISGKKAVNGPAFGAYAEATLQTITSGSQQKVLFQTEEFDTDGCYASSRFTPNVEGYYQLNAEVRLDGSSGTGEIMIILYKNTSEHKRGTNQSGTSIATNFFAMQVSALVYANGTTDYFEIKVQQTSGSLLSVTAVNNPAITWFNGAMVRGA